MNYILIVWTVIALSGGTSIHDWSPLGEFKTESTCSYGAQRLNIDVKLYRCIQK